MNIKFRRYPGETPNGDRATTTEHTWLFTITINDFVVKSISQHDSYWCHNKPYKEVYDEAYKYLVGLCNALDIAPLSTKNYERKEKY